jgi:hypothetical protein
MSLPLEKDEAEGESQMTEEEMEATQLFVGTQLSATQEYVEPNSGDPSSEKKDDSATSAESGQAASADTAEAASVAALEDDEEGLQAFQKAGDHQSASDDEAVPRKRRRLQQDSSEDEDQAEAGGDQQKQVEKAPEEPAEEEWKAMVRCMAPKDLFAILGPGTFPPG